MEDNQFWATVWKCIAVTICTAIISTAGCTAHQNYVQTEVISKSSNPAAVACSFSGSTDQNTPFCVEAAKR